MYLGVYVIALNVAMDVTRFLFPVKSDNMYETAVFRSQIQLSWYVNLSPGNNFN